ncbi:MAG: TetR/AcrR family transcriptional regulator [Gemmatimonadota bacterium]
MCPRPRTLSDADLLQIALRVVDERGAEATRLADVAAASGLAPATLLQRFGSRAALLDAISELLLEQVRPAFAACGQAGLAALRLGLASLPAGRHVIFLAARPAGAAAYSLELRKQIAFALAAAVEQGELPHGEVAALARRIQIEFYGLTVAAWLERTDVDENAIDRMLAEVLGDLV